MPAYVRRRTEIALKLLNTGVIDILFSKVSIIMVTKQLLLIDDDEDNRTLIKLALEMNPDWKVSTAINGIEGITKAEIERPDVILLDFILPGLDGLTVCEVLKSNLFTCTIPVIFVTAMAQDKVLAQLENTLAVGVITKPLDVINLDSQIAKICNWELINQL